MPATLGWSIPGIDLNLSLGPLFLAHCFNWCLYGLLCLQVFMFYASFPRDSRRFKILVYTVFVIDSVSIGLATYSGYWVFVTNWGNAAVFHLLGWSWATVPTSSGLVALIVQSFFAYRIWIISKNRWLPIFIVVLSAIACGFAFGAANEVAHLQTFTYIRHLTPSIWLSFGISADFFVCVGLVYYLLRQPIRYALTNRIIIRLVRISIETALVTMVAAAIKLYLIFSRHDNMHLLFCLLLPRLYSNALLGTLNSRNPIFGGDHKLESRSGRVWTPAAGSSLSNTWRSGKPSDYGHNDKILITCETATDCEAGHGGADHSGADAQSISYEPLVPSYPLSPMAPSYYPRQSGTTSPSPTTPTFR